MPVAQLPIVDPTSPIVPGILAERARHGPPALDQWEDPELRVLYDFCLMPYPCEQATAPRARSVAWLIASFARMDVAAQGQALVHRLTALLSPQCTVWGIKKAPQIDDLWWEFYFYRRPHVPADLSLDKLRPAFAPMAIDSFPPPDVAWTFFSLEVRPEHLRGERPLHVRLYHEDANLSWAVRGDQLELENHYRHFVVDGQLVELLQAIRSSVHAPKHPKTLSTLMPPQLGGAWRVWLARKRRADTVYFQRVTGPQALWMMRKHGWPVDWCDQAEALLPWMQHVRFDLGVNFQRAATGDPPLQFGKTGVYATF